MEKVLNRGLKFAIQPLNLDITQVLVDYKRFERSVRWQEFWHERECDETREVPIFKTKKTNFPKNHQPPQGLKMFLGAVKSEIMDPHNRNRVKCNLTDEELKALKEIVQLQKDLKIVVKPADKGAGITILDYDKYMKASYEHLESKQDGNPYYVKVNEDTLEEAKHKIQNLMEEGFNNKILSKEEYEAMCPEGKSPSKFYCTFKMHKEYHHTETPPVRPIVSGSGSITANPSLYIDHHIKDIAKAHKTFLQDTPHFLRMIDSINKEKKLKENTVLVTWDVIGLYTNIPQDEGVECVASALAEQQNQQIPAEFITRILELVLKNNIFEFNGELFKQLIGTAMGSSCAPDYANVFMDKKIDAKIEKLVKKYSKPENQGLLFMKRFLDDLFALWEGSTKDLHTLLGEMNSLHSSIKFTMNHTTIEDESKDIKCDCQRKESIPFLDMSLSLKEGQIDIDLFRKPSDRNQYLLTSSCHPIETTKNIPHSLAMRINRICIQPENREKRFRELKEMLLEREYGEKMIDHAINRARAIPRAQAIKKVVKNQPSKRPIFVVTFDPRLPNIPNTLKRHWRAMVAQDPYLAEVFPLHPLTAYKRQKNIKDIVVRAKVYQKNRKQRNLKGMAKCNAPCTACPFILEGSNINKSGKSWKIQKNVNCNSENVVYMIECQKENCRQKYIGQTERKMSERFSEHRGYVNRKIISQPTGQHFNSPGHSISDMKVTVIEKIKKTDKMYREERETYFIALFNTFYRGLNKKA